MLSRPDRYALVPPPRLWPVTSKIYIYIQERISQDYTLF